MGIFNFKKKNKASKDNDTVEISTPVQQNNISLFDTFTEFQRRKVDERDPAFDLVEKANNKLIAYGNKLKDIIHTLTELSKLKKAPNISKSVKHSIEKFENYEIVSSGFDGYLYGSWIHGEFYSLNCMATADNGAKVELALRIVNEQLKIEYDKKYLEDDILAKAYSKMVNDIVLNKIEPFRDCIRDFLEES